MTAAQTTMRFFIASGCAIATTMQYRCWHLQEQLRQLGHEAEVVTWVDANKIEPALAANYDAIFLYRLAMSPALRQVIETARAAGKKVFFDIDDLAFEPELIQHQRSALKLAGSESELHASFVRGYLETLLACDAVTLPTALLAEFVRRRKIPAFVHRNALGSEMEKLAKQLFERRRLVTREQMKIVYGSGTPTHEHDFAEVESALIQILEKFPRLELWIVGPLELPASLANEKQIRRFPLSDWRDWFKLASLADIALAPLEQENIFCRAKSEIKFVEAGALGIPIVASRIDPFENCIINGENGFLAGNEREWIEALTLLIEKPARRLEIATAARETVQRDYSGERRTYDLAALLLATSAT